MVSLPAINHNYAVPFKTDTTIKSEWHYSLWNRKQVRVLVDSTEATPSRLIIQELAQSSIAYLINKLLKCLTGHKSSWFDKHVQSVKIEENTLPAGLILPFSTQKQEAITKIQRNTLIAKSHESFGHLVKLGSKLFENAALESQEVKLKTVEMNLKILELSDPLNQISSEDLPIAELQAKYQAFKAKVDMMQKEYSIQLEALIEKNEGIIREIEAQS